MNIKKAILLSLFTPTLALSANYKLTTTTPPQPGQPGPVLELKDCELLEIEGVVNLMQAGFRGNTIDCQTIRFANNSELMIFENIFIKADTIEGNLIINAQNNGFLMMRGSGMPFPPMGMPGSLGVSREQQKKDMIERRNQMCSTLNTNNLPQIGESGKVKPTFPIMARSGNSVLVEVNKFINTNKITFQSPGSDGPATPFTDFEINGKHGIEKGGDGVTGPNGLDGGQGGNLRINYGGSYSEVKDIQFEINNPGGKGAPGQIGGLGGCGKILGKDAPDGKNGYDGVNGYAFFDFGNEFSIITNRTFEASKILEPEQIESVEIKNSDLDYVKEVIKTRSGKNFVFPSKYGIPLAMRVTSTIDSRSSLIVNGEIKISTSSPIKSNYHLNIGRLIFRPNSKLITMTNLKLKTKEASGIINISGSLPQLAKDENVYGNSFFIMNRAQDGGNGGRGGDGPDASMRTTGFPPRIVLRHASAGGTGGRGGDGQNGADGSHGVKGLDGGNGKHILFELDKISDLTRIEINSSGQDGIKGHPGTKGQDGGNGGNGGDGGNGGAAKYGMSAQPGGKGGDAGNGGKGGNGGNGGIGGNGGDAGIIQFIYNGQNSDLTDLEIELNSLGGKGAKGGQGAKGGKGGQPGTPGRGGRGGDGSLLNSDKPGGAPGYGGYAGSSGTDGDNGSNGVHGKDGIPQKPLILRNITEADDSIFVDQKF